LTRGKQEERVGWDGGMKWIEKGRIKEMDEGVCQVCTSGRDLMCLGDGLSGIQFPVDGKRGHTVGN
jgi:hypothetical protein